jgi:outer membrane receptor protein involved in Fe transport
MSLPGLCYAQKSRAAPAPIETAIRPQLLTDALKQFEKLHHMQVLFLTADVKDRRTLGAPAHLTADETLTRLLSGTGLKYRYVDTNAVSIILSSHGNGATHEDMPRPDSDSRHYRQSAMNAPSTQPRAGSQNSNASPPKTPDPPLTLRNSRHDQSPIALGEVTVTAQKYSQPAFDVPISLDVISSHELRRLDINSLNDLQYDVSGLHVEGGAVYNYIVLRGVSNVSGNGAIVGEYIDEADISADGYAGQVGYGTGDFQLYDLERVEVLKGPQGTLYGDGALGGVIRYITNKPALNQYEMNADVSTLFTEDGAPSQRTEVMLNSPLLAGTAALRIAGQFQHEGGWVDEPAARLKNFNDLNLTDVRIEGLWMPTAHFKVLATQVIHREAYGIGSGEDAEGDYSPVYGVTSPPNGQQGLNLSNITVTADMPIAQLVSSSTYMTHTEVNDNQSYVFPPTLELESYFPLTNASFGEEVRLHSAPQGPWQWTLGGFYKDYRDSTSVSEYFGSAGPISTATYYQLIGTSEQSKDAAVFADTSVKLLDRVTLGAGVRYFNGDFRIQTLGSMEDNVIAAPANSAHDRSTSTDPRFYLEYNLTSHVNAYTSAAKGFRSGEPNLGLFQGFSPESLWSYELGTKVRFLRDRLTSDVDVFDEEYSNYVGEGLVTVYDIPEFGSFNIGAARIRGLDVDFAWRVSDGWRVSAKGEAVDSKFVAITAGDTGFEPGDRVPYVPDYTLAASIEREFRFGDKPGFAQMNYSQTASVEGYGTPVVRSDVMHFLGFKIGVRWSREFEIAVFAQNLLNNRGYLDPDQNEAAAFRPRPRTFGIDFRVSNE